MSISDIWKRNKIHNRAREEFSKKENDSFRTEIPKTDVCNRLATELLKTFRQMVESNVESASIKASTASIRENFSPHLIKNENWVNLDLCTDEIDKTFRKEGLRYYGYKVEAGKGPILKLDIHEDQDKLGLVPWVQSF